MDKKTPSQQIKENGLGYPKIEEILESENFEPINKSFSEAYDKLEIIHQDGSSGLKKQKAAKKAMQSYELTISLLNELIQLKYQLVNSQKENQGDAKKK